MECLLGVEIQKRAEKRVAQQQQRQHQVKPSGGKNYPQVEKKVIQMNRKTSRK